MNGEKWAVQLFIKSYHYNKEGKLVEYAPKYEDWGSEVAAELKELGKKNKIGKYEVSPN